MVTICRVVGYDGSIGHSFSIIYYHIHGDGNDLRLLIHGNVDGNSEFQSCGDGELSDCL